MLGFLVLGGEGENRLTPRSLFGCSEVFDVLFWPTSTTQQRAAITPRKVL
ncbi:MAG: hypothetical protein JWR17_2544 [Pseudomonas sp.]|jgi:hypothetical protein|nr:hypothetical protein [Pseudomonas sp.]